MIDFTNILGKEFMVKLFVIPTVLGFLFVFRHIINHYLKHTNKYLVFCLYSLNFFVWMAILRILFNRIDPNAVQGYLISDISLMLVTIVVNYFLYSLDDYAEYTVIPTLVVFLGLYLFTYEFDWLKVLAVIAGLVLFWFTIMKVFRHREYINKYSLIFYPIIGFAVNISVFLLYSTIATWHDSYFLEVYIKTSLPIYFFQIYIKIVFLLFLAKIVFSAINIIIKEYNLMKKNIYIDDLTQVYNRRKFEEVLKDLLISKNITMFSVVLFDVDAFKHINDTYGHGSGDYVLKRLCELVKETLKEEQSNGQLFRYGGDEFFLIFRNVTGMNAKFVMEKVLRKISGELFEYRGHCFKITISAGISEITEFMDRNEVIHQVDESLYVAKHKGKNQVYYKED